MQLTFLSTPVVLHDFDAKLDEVPREHLSYWTLLSALAQSLVVDECPIAALGVLDIELSTEKGNGICNHP